MVWKYYWKLEKYISWEFLFSFIVSFLFYFLIFLLNQLLLLAKEILAKGISLGSVLLLMLYSLPTFITLTVPFATLTAALMTYGRFSSDNEILAMRSVGFNRFVIFRPVLVGGLSLALLSFMINDYLLPAGNQAFQRLWLELTITNPGLELSEFSVRKFGKSILVTGHIDKTGIHPLAIIKKDNSGNRTTLMARLATPEIRSRSGRVPGFNMYDIFSLTPDSKDKEGWSWSRATSMEYRPITNDSTILNQQSGPANMRVMDVYNVVKEKKQRHNELLASHDFNTNNALWSLSLYYAALASGSSAKRTDIKTHIKDNYDSFEKLRSNKPVNHSLQVWTLEYYQKFAIPFACIPFVILAFPLGLSARRSGRAVGFFIGLILASFYWSLLIIGRSLGLRSTISPFMVMLLPDILLLVIGVILFIRRSRI